MISVDVQTHPLKMMSFLLEDALTVLTTVHLMTHASLIEIDFDRGHHRDTLVNPERLEFVMHVSK